MLLLLVVVVVKVVVIIVKNVVAENVAVVVVVVDIFGSAFQSLKGKTGTTVCTDEASTREKKKIAVAIVDPEGNTFAAGLREVKTKKAEHMFESVQHVFSDLDARIAATQPKDGESAKKNHILLKEIRATMSDRASTQKLLNQHIEDLVNDVIPQFEAALPHLEPADIPPLIDLKNHYCGIHYLVHMAEVMSSAANEAEMAEFDGEPPAHKSSFKKNPNESTTVAMIRKACKAFAAGGCEKSGCFGKADLFLKPILKSKFGVNSMPITQFRGHRFNVMPINAKYIY